LRALLARLNLQRAWLYRALIYAMGSVAAFWSLERIALVFRG
jgi:hypothetical protein